MSSSPLDQTANDGMKMAELSRVSGVPVASIKFYLREGLLPAGARLSATQSRYHAAHARRLRLIRALREVGKVRIEGIRKICASLDNDEPDIFSVLGCISDAMAAHAESAPVPGSFEQAAADVDAFLARTGLPHREESAARQQLVTALVALRAYIHPRMPAATFQPYVESMRQLAAWEMSMSRTPETMGLAADTTARLEATVYGTILFEPVILAIRRLLHEQLAEAERSSSDEPSTHDALATRPPAASRAARS